MIMTLLQRAANRWPSRVAVLDEHGPVTFRALADRVSRLGNALQGLGLRTGDRVADVQANARGAIEADLACAAAGVVRVALALDRGERQLVALCRDAAPAAAIVGGADAGLATALRAEVESIRDLLGVAGALEATGVHDCDALIARASPRAPAGWHAPGHAVAIHYSAGTTGAPKGCLHTVRNRLVSLAAIEQAVTGPLSPDDVFLHAAPLPRASGLFVLAHVAAGARQVVLADFEPDRALDALARHGVTATVLEPAMLDQLLDVLEATGSSGASLPRLRRIAYTGAPIAPERLARAQRALPGRLVQLYGLAESIAPLTVLRPEEHGDDELLRSAGRPLPTVALRVVGDERRPLAAGETGELVVAGDHVMAGYWSGRAPSANALSSGWLRTGDMAHCDERGYLFLDDRRADLIVTGGAQVMPREVELVLAAVPGVREVAVVGLPDREWGELSVAFVVREGPRHPSADELRAHCAERLSARKVPARVEFVDALPRDATGGVRRSALRAHATPT